MDEFDEKLRRDMKDMLEELALTRAEFDFEADSILTMLRRKTAEAHDAGENR